MNNYYQYFIWIFRRLLIIPIILISISYNSMVIAQYSSSAIARGSEAESNQDTVIGPLEMGSVVVMEQKLRLQTKVGSYQQPIWTTMRMFPSTRVYVMNPPGSAMYERWFDIRDRKDGPAQIRMRDEFTFGLGGRFQLDLYSHTVYDGENGDMSFGWRGFSWELRYALADWGKLFGNPTLYFETKMLNGRWGIEPKLLLGDRLGDNGIWGLNFIYEGNLASEREQQEREYAATASYGYIISTDFTVGASAMFRYNDYEGISQEYYAGPLVQYRFNSRSYLSCEMMPGLTTLSYASRTMLIFAWRF